ncbi:MAG: hypothetical protein AAGD28_21055, partial [Bacteroidota bacterium]
MKDYMPIFHELFAGLGLRKFAIYGSATGAQLAIRYGLTYPKEVEHIFLDNAAHFTDEQYEKIMENYFPDLSPQYDGSHLVKMWNIVRDMFRYFPWYMRDESFKLNLPPLPAAVYHRVAMDFLQAGANYNLAYKAAFAHERVANVKSLKVPATVFKHKASIVLPYIKQLIDHPSFPSKVEVIETPPAPLERNDRMKAHMMKHLPSTTEEVDLSDRSSHVSRQFIKKIKGFYLHGWQRKAGTGIAKVIVPRSGDSAALLKEEMEVLLKGKPGIIVSLPGQGDSELRDKKLNQEEIEDLLALLMKELGFKNFEIAYSQIATDKLEIQEPDAYGLYMKKAWIELREMNPHDPDPEKLNLILLEKLKNRES